MAATAAAVYREAPSLGRLLAHLTPESSRDIHLSDAIPFSLRARRTTISAAVLSMNKSAARQRVLVHIPLSIRC